MWGRVKIRFVVDVGYYTGLLGDKGLFGVLFGLRLGCSGNLHGWGWWCENV